MEGVYYVKDLPFLKSTVLSSNAVLKLYVNNLFDEDYENSRGYAMTDQTYGAAINFEF